jgi:HEPN domain-containing protein
LLKALHEALDALRADPDDFEHGEYDQIIESAKYQAELAIERAMVAHTQPLIPSEQTEGR